MSVPGETFPIETPILDSGVLPAKKRASFGAALYGVLLGIPFGLALILAANVASRGRNSAGNFIFGSYILAFLAALIVHECGHLLAGWMVGFRFSSITIGPISLFLEYGRLRLQIRRTMPASGYAGMQIDRIWRLRRRLFLFVIAGPAANLGSSIMVFVFRRYVHPLETWLTVFFYLFGVISLVLGLASILPFRIGVVYPDGARMWMMVSSKARTRRWLSLTALGRDSRRGVRPRAYRRTWLNAATAMSDRSVDDFSGNWTAYVSANDRKDEHSASFHLERCLGLVKLLGPSLQDLVALEASVFTAWFREDAATSEKWLAQVKKTSALPKLMHIRAEVALACARGEFTSAVSRLEETFAFIEKLPQTAIKQRLMEGFLEWQQEIRDRESLKRAASESLSRIETAPIPT